MASIYFRVLIVCLVSPFISVMVQANQPLQPMDIFALEHASSPQISPDAKQVVYVRHHSDVMTDSRYTNLWLVSADGKDHRPLSAGKHSAYGSSWSPDGNRLAYISTESDKPQIYVRWMDTGVTAAITNLTQSPSVLKWSPDGSQIAFAMLVPEAPLMIGEVPTPPAGAEWAEPAKMTDKLTFRFNGIGEVAPGYSHLFVVPAEGGTPRQVTHGNYHHGGFFSTAADYVWAPDGKSLIFSTNRSDNWEYESPETQLYEIALAGGEVKQLTHRKGPDKEVTISPDGKQIAYTGYDERYQGYQLTNLYLANRDGSNARVISKNLDRTVTGPQWAADGRSIYAVFVSEGIAKLAQFDLKGGHKILAENLGTGATAYAGGGYSLSDNGNYALATKTSYAPSDVAIGRGGRKLKQLTSLNNSLLTHRELGQVEELWWDSSQDGRPVQGWIIKPPQFDPAKKYPLILEIHGGPFAAYGPSFDIEKQLLAAAGYVVLYANPRGSTSYGEEFGNLIHHSYPGDDFFDLNSGVDALIKQGYLDDQQLYVTGGSGGGVLTAWLIGRSNRFRAAVPFYPVINWESFVFTTDVVTWTVNNVMPGLPWDHRENYEKRSLLAVSKNVKTPTLIMTGEEDWRTPMSESEQYYKALKLQGVDTVLVRVPGESHGIRARPSHQMSKVTTTLGWFEKYSAN